MRVHVRVHAVRRRVAHAVHQLPRWPPSSRIVPDLLRLPELRRRDRVAAAERPEQARLQLAQPVLRAPAVERTERRRSRLAEGEVSGAHRRVDGVEHAPREALRHDEGLVDLVIRQVVAQREEGEPGRVGQMRRRAGQVIVLLIAKGRQDARQIAGPTDVPIQGPQPAEAASLPPRRELAAARISYEHADEAGEIAGGGPRPVPSERI